MVITLRKRETGELVFSVNDNGKILSLSQASEILTQCKSNDDTGIFSVLKDYKSFVFGLYENSIEYSNLYDKNPQQIEEIIRDRLYELKSWVQECKDREYVHVFTL